LPVWKLLIPHGVHGWGGVAILGAAAGISFHDTVNLGSVILALGLVIAAGVFSLRNNLKSVWKNLAEERGEQVKQLEREIHDKMVEMAAFAEDQRGLRHQLKNELATQGAQLEIERAKHDMTQVFDRLDAIDLILANRWPEFEKIEQMEEQQIELLRRIDLKLGQR